MPNESEQSKGAGRDGPATAGPEPTDPVPDLQVPDGLALGDTLPEQAGVYVPPRPVAAAREHRTIEIAPVRLSAEIDPRKRATQLRLSAPPPRRSGSTLLAIPLLLGCAVLIGLYLRYRAPAAPAPSPAAPPALVAEAPGPANLPTEQARVPPTPAAPALPAVPASALSREAPPAAHVPVAAVASTRVRTQSASERPPKKDEKRAWLE